MNRLNDMIIEHLGRLGMSLLQIVEVLPHIVQYVELTEKVNRVIKSLLDS